LIPGVVFLKSGTLIRNLLGLPGFTLVRPFFGNLNGSLFTDFFTDAADLAFLGMGQLGHPIDYLDGLIRADVGTNSTSDATPGIDLTGSFSFYHFHSSLVFTLDFLSAGSGQTI
jgi:hypothetical protein